MCWSSHHRSNWDWSEDRAPEPASSPISTPGNFRASDAERNAVVDLLRRHVGDGRLTLVEFEGRVDDTMAARTGDDLRAVLRDLPPLPNPAAEQRQRAARRQAQWSRLTPVLMIAAMLLLFSALVGHIVIWPLFIVLFFRFGPGRRRRHPRIA